LFFNTGVSLKTASPVVEQNESPALFTQSAEVALWSEDLKSKPGLKPPSALRAAVTSPCQEDTPLMFAACGGDILAAAGEPRLALLAADVPDRHMPEIWGEPLQAKVQPADGFFLEMNTVKVEPPSSVVSH